MLGDELVKQQWGAWTIKKATCATNLTCNEKIHVKFLLVFCGLMAIKMQCMSRWFIITILVIQVCCCSTAVGEYAGQVRKPRQTTLVRACAKVVLASKLCFVRKKRIFANN